MPIISMNEKFAYALGEIYDAERRFLAAQQTMLQQADSSELQQMLQEHIGETEQQIQTIEQVCQIMGLPTAPVPATDAEGLVRHGEQLLAQAGLVPALSDCVIADAQAKVEHFEVACYRSLILGAQAMGQQEVVQLLEQNLQQEEQMAQRVEEGARALVERALQHEGQALERGGATPQVGSATGGTTELEGGIDAGLTDLGDDVYRGAGNDRSTMRGTTSRMEGGIDAGLTDLGDDVYRGAGNDRSTMRGTNGGLEGGIDPRITDLGDDADRPA